MSNKHLLVQYCESLCRELSSNGIRKKLRRGGEIEYETDPTCPEATIMAITENLEAFKFLKNQGLIRNDICHFCGKKIDGKFTFTEPINLMTINICRACHFAGKKDQEIFLGNGPKQGCLLTLLMLICIPVLIILLSVL